MNILSWAIFGLIVGVITNALDSKQGQSGLLGSITLGVFGALVGGFLGEVLFGVGVSGFNLSSFIVAVAGALLLMLVGRAIYNQKTV